MEILKINNSFEQILKTSAQAIKQGKVLICPSDTVYGLICDARNERAVKRLFEIKKRPLEKAIALFVKDIKMAKEFAQIDRSQEAILKKLWPGKTTVILKRQKGCQLPKILFAGTKVIGLRMVTHRLLNALLKQLNFPLAETSANISGQPASTKNKEVLAQFKNKPPTTFGTKVVGGQPDLVLDAGNLKPSLPSTVIDLTSKKIKVLRKGAVKI